MDRRTFFQNSLGVVGAAALLRDGAWYASWLMFNLNEYPHELINLAHCNAYRTERKKLIDTLKQWVSDTGDTFEVQDN